MLGFGFLLCCLSSCVLAFFYATCTLYTQLVHAVNFLFFAGHLLYCDCHVDERPGISSPLYDKFKVSRAMVRQSVPRVHGWELQMFVA
jgi:hypothetical protein